MKILVTGGAGFIGSHIVDSLIDQGDDVVVVDDLSSGNRKHINAKARLYAVDFTDVSTLSKIFRDEQPEVVNHHGAQTNVRHSMSDPSHDAKVNVLGSVSVLQLCVQEPSVRKIIFASTCAVYSEPNFLPMDESHPTIPQSVYGVSKLAVESYIKFFSNVYDLTYTIFRYGNVYGTRQDPTGEAGVVNIFASQLLSGNQPTIFGDGTKTRDYVSVRDVVSANLSVIGDVGNNEVFNIARGEGVSDFEIYDAVRSTVGSNIQAIYADRRKGEAEHVVLDCRKANKNLSWRPEVRILDGVSEVVKAFSG